MSWLYALAVVAPLLVAFLRDLVLVVGDVVRRSSIERILCGASAPVWVTDRTCDGGVIEITVGPV